MDEPPPYRIDIDGIEDPARGARGRGGLRRRPWVGIHFDCCSAYTRVYRNREGTAYQGCCPRCLRQIALRIGPQGTDARFFTAQ